jgi:pimeloyl-ACP methyl ester carboxylesterase
MKLIKVFKIVLAINLLLVLIIVVVFSHKDIPLNELKIKYTNSDSSFINIEGTNVHYRDEGSSSDSIPIILIHGTGSSLHAYDIWSDNLKKSNRVIRMDLPAFGLTGPFLKRDYTISNYTTFLKEFLDSLNIKQCILVGNSLGGEIAWRFAIQEPVMSRKLILLDPSGYPVISKSVPIAFKLAKIPVLNKFLTYITPRFLVRASIENVYFDKSKVSDSLVNRYFDLTLRKGNRKAIVDRLKVSTTLTNGTKTHDNIKKIKQPTLIIWGSDDQLIPVENGYKFKNDITNSKLIVMKQTGHVPMEEKPLISLNFAIDFINN